MTTLTIDQAIEKLEATAQDRKYDRESCWYDDILWSIEGLTDDTIEQTKQNHVSTALTVFPELTALEARLSDDATHCFWYFFECELIELARNKYAKCLSPEQITKFNTIDVMLLPYFDKGLSMGEMFRSMLLLTLFFTEKKVVTLEQIFRDLQVISTHKLLDHAYNLDQKTLQEEKELYRIEKLLENVPQDICECDLATLEKQVDFYIDTYPETSIPHTDWPKEILKEKTMVIKKRDKVREFRDLKKQYNDQKEKVQKLAIESLRVNGEKYFWRTYEM